MTELSQPSGTASSKDTPGSWSPAVERLQRVQAAHDRQRRAAEPKRLPASIPPMIQTACQACEGETVDYEERERRERILTLWEMSDVPARHAAAKTEALHGGGWMQQGSLLRCRMGRGCLVALLGPPGSGKTQMAVELIRGECGKLRTCRYTTVIEFIMEIRATFGATGLSELDVFRRHCEPELLVLDEVGERGESAWEDRQLGFLCDKRYRSMIDTVLISNQRRRDFLESVGPRVAGRLQETGGVVECTWKSFRLGIGEQEAT